MTTKKLSEIGRELWLFNETAGSADGLSINCSDGYPARAYSFDERRELVRRVWNRAQDQRSALHMEGARDMSAEEFMEREGL